MRVQFSGRTPAFQAGYVGSIPITRLTYAIRIRLCVRSSAGQSNGLLSRGSGVRIPSGTFWILPEQAWHGGYSAVGQRARLWLWRPRVRIPLATLHNGLSPSGKAQDFDSCIRWFESSQPSQGQQINNSYNYGPLAQMVEHLTFNQVVWGSIPQWLTERCKIFLTSFFFV